jgi:hypothetical protein
MVTYFLTMALRLLRDQQEFAGAGLGQAKEAGQGRKGKRIEHDRWATAALANSRYREFPDPRLRD